MPEKKQQNCREPGCPDMQRKQPRKSDGDGKGTGRAYFTDCDVNGERNYRPDGETLCRYSRDCTRERVKQDIYGASRLANGCGQVEEPRWAQPVPIPHVREHARHKSAKSAKSKKSEESEESEESLPTEPASKPTSMSVKEYLQRQGTGKARFVECDILGERLLSEKGNRCRYSEDCTRRRQMNNVPGYHSLAAGCGQVSVEDSKEGGSTTTPSTVSSTEWHQIRRDHITATAPAPSQPWARVQGESLPVAHSMARFAPEPATRTKIQTRSQTTEPGRCVPVPCEKTAPRKRPPSRASNERYKLHEHVLSKDGLHVYQKTQARKTGKFHWTYLHSL